MYDRESLVSESNSAESCRAYCTTASFQQKKLRAGERDWLIVKFWSALKVRHHSYLPIQYHEFTTRECLSMACYASRKKLREIISKRSWKTGAEFTDLNGLYLKIEIAHTSLQKRWGFKFLQNLIHVRFYQDCRSDLIVNKKLYFWFLIIGGQPWV